MTITEFSAAMAYMSVAMQKPVSRDTVEVYFDLLKDIPGDVLQAAIKVVILEHKWATLPTAAEIRETAQSLLAREPSFDEAWALSWRIASRLDPDIEGPYFAGGKLWPSQWDYLTKDAPPRVVEAIRCFGINSLTSKSEIISVVRAQFFKVYGQIMARQKRDALLPPSLKKDIGRLQKYDGLKLLEGIGEEPKAG